MSFDNSIDYSAFSSIANGDLARANLLASLGGLVGVIANRPAAGNLGTIYYATDEDRFYHDNGTTWDILPTSGILTAWSGALATTTSTASSEPDAGNFAPTILVPGDYHILTNLAIGLSQADDLEITFKKNTTVTDTLTITFGTYNNYPTSQFVPINARIAMDGLVTNDVIHMEWRLISGGGTASLRHHQMIVLRRNG